VGLCRIHIRLDLCIYCALSRQRWRHGIRSSGMAPDPGHLLPNAPGKPPVPGDGHTVVKSESLTGKLLLGG